VALSPREFKALKVSSLGGDVLEFLGLVPCSTVLQVGFSPRGGIFRFGC